MKKGHNGKSRRWILYILSMLLVIAVMGLGALKYCEELAAWKKTVGPKFSLSGIISQMTGNTGGADVDEDDAAANGNGEITEDIAFDASSYEPLVSSEDAWYRNITVIAHACGGIDGLTYTNSREALQQSLDKGMTYIEVDFNYTSDGQLVCMHNWNKQWKQDVIPTAEEFFNGKIYGKYTPMSAEEIIKCMAENQDLHFVIDTKADMEQVVASLADLAEPYPGVMDRFIVQLYDENQKEKIQKIYPFADDNFLFTAYKFGLYPNRLLKVCLDENIHVLTVHKNKLSQEEIAMFTEKGITVFEHTLNRIDRAKERLSIGVHGIYSDFLMEEDLS